MEIQNSERLSFGLMDENDAALLFELDQDVEVMRYINGGIKTSMQEIKNSFIPRLNSFTERKKGWGLWQVNRLDNQQFIGWILVRPMHFFSDNPEYSNLELGWRFKRASWGQGYATEAANAVKQAFIDNPDIRQFSAIANPENSGSINIMRKIGMGFISNNKRNDPNGKDDVVLYQCDN